ncbi:Uncharacterized protein HZ326_28473 [Fusarium oxysporum f. sp. albedinis]|nr:Uncharacterized protein HZ326_28473 [Fusarium oxysporum f. sp. albedinis]
MDSPGAVAVSIQRDSSVKVLTDDPCAYAPRSVKYSPDRKKLILRNNVTNTQIYSDKLKPCNIPPFYK